MASVKIRIHVDEISNVMTRYNRIKVYRATTRDGTYAEITVLATRIVLVAGQPLYEYIDAAVPSSSYWYKTSYYHEATLLESSLSDPIQGSDLSLIVSIQDIRDEGITSSDLSDDRTLMLSRGWQDWFEKKCGQWFTAKTMELLMDGNGCRVLWLPVPIISLTALYMNDDFVNVVDPTYYVVYNRYFPEDDRRNPRIKMKRSTEEFFFSVTSGDPQRGFAVGDQNQKLVGSFGYVEEDGFPPFAVKRAILILIRMAAEQMGDSEIDILRAGRLVEEVTDRHRVKFSDLYDTLGKWGATGITEVDDALAMYRRPAFIDMARSFVV